MNISGSVHGGQPPVSGAKVYLYAAATTGYGAASISRLSGVGYATTDANGLFTLTTQNTCQASDLVYVLAVGGNPGMTAGTNNSALQMMTALGPCSSLLSTTFISINEATTVAAVTALAPFMVDGTHIATSATNVAGLTTAFAAANNLANPVSGVALATTTAGNGTVPQKEIDSLANAVAACVNTDGTGTPCSRLFTDTTPAGGAAPTNTLAALLDLALIPSNSATDLYNLGLANAPFQPALTAAPADWSMAIAFTAQLASPFGIAVDAQGYVWITNFGESSVSELTGTGTIVSSNITGGGLSGAQFAAIDLAGSLWTVNPNINSLSAFSTGGVAVSTSAGFTGGGLGSDVQVAIDGAGIVWTANTSNNSVSKFNSTGTIGSPITTPPGITGFPGAQSIAIDPAGFVWVGDGTDGSIVKLHNDGTTPAVYAAGAGTPTGIAIDASNNVWISSYYSNSVLRLNSSGVSQATYNGSVAHPYGIALDGGGNAWVANSYSTGISRIQGSVGAQGPAGTITLYTVPGTISANPGGITADPSGCVWLLTGNTVVEFVGAAVPTAMPYSTAIKNGKLASKP
jgi:streptogramin lyase